MMRRPFLPFCKKVLRRSRPRLYPNLKIQRPCNRDGKSRAHVSRCLLNKSWTTILHAFSLGQEFHPLGYRSPQLEMPNHSRNLGPSQLPSGTPNPQTRQSLGLGWTNGHQCEVQFDRVDFVAGKNRVPCPATGKIALVTFLFISKPFLAFIICPTTVVWLGGIREDFRHHPALGVILYPAPLILPQFALYTKDC